MAKSALALYTVSLMALLGSVSAAHAADRNVLAAAAASITADELRTFVDTLADDTFEGREVGSRGGRAAGNYLVQAFEQRGAKPAGDNGSYFQAFNGSARNILGVFEGSDARLKEQVIVIGAHYDHVGYGRSTNSFGPLGYIHNGADDNASGVAGLLEVMDAVQRLPQAPGRTILFACWDGEEGGLHGSRHWVSHPTLPLSRVVLAINVDMIGRMRNGQIEVFGTRTAPGLRRLVSEANGAGAAQLKFDWRIKADSDHWPFFERQIPFLMFHTGLHGDYHRPSDDAHLINHAGLQTTAQLIFSALMHLADAESLPAYREAAWREIGQSPSSLEQPVTPQAPRYGMPFRIEREETLRVIVTDIIPGSPAERGGLKTGDRLLEFQGAPIVDDARLRLELLAAAGETTFLVQREGVETPQLIKVTPRGEPVRIGITWRMDEGEPGTAIVTQVIYGSAAHAAGIRLADRIHSVGGRTFRTQEEFIQRLTSAVSPLEIVFERSGKMHSALLTLAEQIPAAE